MAIYVQLMKWTEQGRKNAESLPDRVEAVQKRVQDMGVKILDVNGKLRPQTDLLTEVAQALLKMPEGAQRAQAAVTLFGKSGQDLIPILRQLSEGNDYLIQKYSRGPRWDQ